MWGGGETPVAPGGDGWGAQQGEDFWIVKPWLAPGQMELYRVDQEGK